MTYTDVTKVTDVGYTLLLCAMPYWIPPWILLTLPTLAKHATSKCIKQTYKPYTFVSNISIYLGAFSYIKVFTEKNKRIIIIIVIM